MGFAFQEPHYMIGAITTVNNKSGFSLLEVIGVMAVIVILSSLLLPTVIHRLDAGAQNAEVENLASIAQAIELSLRENRAWPADLASLSPNYLAMNTNQIIQNKAGFPRYYVIHPNTSGFTNAAGLAPTDLDDARFLLISHLKTDAAPTITNAAEFDAWWNTDETTTPNLKIHRGSVANWFRLLDLSADVAGGSYRIDGVATNPGCGNLTTHSRYHLPGTMVGLDEAGTYSVSEVQFSQGSDIGYRFNCGLPTGSRWRKDPSQGPSCWSLWFSSTSNVGASGASCLNSWSNAGIVQLKQPNLAFEPGTTSGTFSSITDLNNFSFSTDIAAMHYVSRNMTVGGATSPSIDLLVGDILLTVAYFTVLTSTNTITVVEDDVFVFRPDTPGNYTSGTFTYLLDNPAGAFVAITGISLVEQDTIVGGQTLQAGTFLYSRSWSANKNKIYHYTADDVGVFSTAGTTTTLIDGSNISMGGTTGGSAGVAGIDLVESNRTIGGTTLQSGQILVTLDKDDSAVGNGTPIATKENDIFILDVTTTGSGTTDATAILFLEGGDANLDSSSENIDGLTLAPTL
ncbi:MAG: hypothetical protein NPIRA04_20590 [Nitrospirales bacterium]|nr:MAG: hypothetical protein NPIRA04_20590 [Nitrospirales bacterium]